MWKLDERTKNQEDKVREKLREILSKVLIKIVCYELYVINLQAQSKSSKI